MRTFITGIGIISPLGTGYSETMASLEKGTCGIGPSTLFPASEISSPVGEARPEFDAPVPRTHRLASVAAGEAVETSGRVPDAIVIGVATGGMPSTERHLKSESRDPKAYACHSAGSVADWLAASFGCKGPVITVSTACSSGAAAIKLALEMIRGGMARNVLAGGADALCGLTLHGFGSLQLVDPNGARPLDKDRKGMTVSEGAAMLMLSASETRPENAVAAILGAGLSCDAWHPAAPSPDGRGAIEAITAAIRDAGITASDIRYINLHGTGTPDNDLSEAKAVNALFSKNMPPVSSVKGAFGHSLAASGAIEAAVSAMTASKGLIPANTGCVAPDPELGLDPVKKPFFTTPGITLSNSFGFGGNNAAVIIGPVDTLARETSPKKIARLEVAGYACITGAGRTANTMAKMPGGETCAGLLPISEISRNLNPKFVRRLKRLPRMALSLAVEAYENSTQCGVHLRQPEHTPHAPSAVFFGTGWGSLSETHNFLRLLFESNEQFSSPTDFVGSVHNAPAGQMAIHFGAKGPNITTTGGDYSFEQTLMSACLLADETGGSMVVAGADEHHDVLSDLFDGSVRKAGAPSDGGAAFILECPAGLGNPTLFPSFFENAENNPSVITSLVNRLGGPVVIGENFGAVLAGIPREFHDTGKTQLNQFMEAAAFEGPVVDYRKSTGEFASASAVAAAMAVRFVTDGLIPGGLCPNRTDCGLAGKGILILGLGRFVTAVEVSKGGTP